MDERMNNKEIIKVSLSGSTVFLDKLFILLQLFLVELYVFFKPAAELIKSVSILLAHTWSFRTTIGDFFGDRLPYDSGCFWNR